MYITAYILHNVILDILTNDRSQQKYSKWVWQRDLKLHFIKINTHLVPAEIELDLKGQKQK